MLAVVKARPGPGIDIEERPIPTLGSADHVLLEVDACGVCGSDVGFYDWLPHLAAELELPRVLGHEVLGRVTAVGSRVNGLSIGDRVVTETSTACGRCFQCERDRSNLCERQQRLGQHRDGGFAQFVLTAATTVHKVPSGFSLESAVMIETVASALHCFERLSVKPGDDLVVLGPGPIGLSAALIAKSTGANVMVSGLPEDSSRLALARELGLDTALAGATLDARVAERTQGKGPDIVIDASGGDEALSEAIGLVRPGGQIGLLGISPPGAIHSREIVIKELTLFGSFRRRPSSWQRAIRLVGSGLIAVERLVTHRYGLRSVESAFEAVRRREALKAIVIPTSVPS